MNFTRTAVITLVTSFAMALAFQPTVATAKTEKKKEGAKSKMTTPQRPVVVLETSKGNIEIELYNDKASNTVENFLKYVDKGHYNGTIFHRVIPSFMIQGGGFTAEMTEKPTYKGITNEADNGVSNRKGTLAMARTSDPHSASAQFFINVKDNGFLDHSGKTPDGWGYAVFGEVKSGMDVVEAIKDVKTTKKNGHSDVPVEAVVIKTAKRK